MTARPNEPPSPRPFESVPIRKRSLIRTLWDPSREEDARGALETQLAKHGVESVSPDSVQVLLKGFGITGGEAREMLIEVWGEALKNLIFNDGKIDDAENTYLTSLRLALDLRTRKWRKYAPRL